MTPPSPHNGTANTESPAITTTPSEPTVTELFEITLSGLTPGQRVTLHATFEDLGACWRGEATFQADRNGTVSLTETAPIQGAYTGSRPMGLIQFANQHSAGPIDSRSGRTRTELTLTAESEGELIAETTVVRTIAQNVNQQELDPDRDGLGGRIYKPSAPGPHPAIVVLHGTGAEPYGRKGRLLAANGFVVLSLRYSGGPAPVPDEFAEVPVAYVGKAFDFLYDHDAVAAGDIGLIGSSRGTELAFLTAAHRDDVGIVVAYAPSAYAWPGESESDEDASAWTVDGKPHPTVPHPGPEVARPEETDEGLRPRSVFEACVENASEDALAAARLAVDTIDTDVVLISGDDDGIWPASEMAESIVTAMEDTPGSVTHHSYDDAGHSIFLPFHPTTERAILRAAEGPNVVTGGTAAGNANADCDSWQIVTRQLETLRR